MALKDEDPESAREAWAEFFERHWRYLLAVCRRSYGGSLDELGVEDLTKDTLIRAYDKAATFRPVAGVDLKARRRLVQGWLGRIANRLFLTSWRANQRTGVSLVSIDELMADGWELAAPEKSDANCEADSEDLQVLQQALATLTAREREVLVASYAWYDDARGLHRMPDSELGALAAKYQTTPVNIRKIRSRAKEKVEDYINSRSITRRVDAE